MSKRDYRSALRKCRRELRYWQKRYEELQLRTFELEAEHDELREDAICWRQRFELDGGEP